LKPNKADKKTKFVKNNTMTVKDIAFDLKTLISKTNEDLKSFKRFNYPAFDEILGVDRPILEKALAKITRVFKIYFFSAILFTSVLVIASMAKFLELFDIGNMNKAGLYILFTLVFLINTFKYYKLKTALESKLCFLKLLEKVLA
jgi:hypothetical protein